MEKYTEEENELYNEIVLDEIKKEADEKANLEKERDEFKEKYLYARADADNIRRRSISERADLIFNSKANVIKAILPLVDDFERAVEMNEDMNDAEVLKNSFKVMHNKFVTTLSRIGVEPVETENADFDTDSHEAVATIKIDDENLNGKVIDCTEKGYTLNGKVIRFAKVAVGEYVTH